MRKRKRQTVKKLIQYVAIIAAGVLAIILFMLAIWYRGKNSEPVTDEQVAAQMQQAEPLVIETPEAAAEGSIRVYDYDGCCIYAYYGKIRINNDGKDIDVEAIGYLEGYYKKYAAGNGTKYYRVRKSWTDAASQLGAFTSLENAKSACKAGYTVYDDNGKAVYTAAGQQASAGVPFSVQVDILDLNIRTGAGTNYAKTGETTGKGVFTIVEVKAGQGASVGWGRLKSGAGWISLDYATRLA